VSGNSDDGDNFNVWVKYSDEANENDTWNVLDAMNVRVALKYNDFENRIEEGAISDKEINCEFK
jgi:hypothetical protein